MIKQIFQNGKRQNKAAIRKKISVITEKFFFCYLQIVESTGTRDRSRLPGICQGNVSSAHTDHGWRKGETPRALETIGNRGQRKIRRDWTLGGSARVSGCHYWPQSV